MIILPALFRKIDNYLRHLIKPSSSKINKIRGLKKLAILSNNYVTIRKINKTYF